jgi:hypothetical protein
MRQTQSKHNFTALSFRKASRCGRVRKKRFWFRSPGAVSRMICPRTHKSRNPLIAEERKSLGEPNGAATIMQGNPGDQRPWRFARRCETRQQTRGRPLAARKRGVQAVGLDAATRPPGVEREIFLLTSRFIGHPLTSSIFDGAIRGGLHSRFCGILPRLGSFGMSRSRLPVFVDLHAG